MANKLDRIEKDIEKTKAKIAELQKQLRELEAAKTEQENLQIIQLVRGLNMNPEEFAAFLRGGALLVETSYFNPPMGLNNILLRIKSKGYVPVLAHPERYVYMELKDYEQLNRINVAFQLNLSSIVGGYGSEVKKKAEWLLRNGFYGLTGSDTHCLAAWETTIARKITKIEDLPLKNRGMLS